MDDVDVQDEVDESTPLPAGMRDEHGKVVPHLTVEEREARGKAARREVPRESHAGFTPGSLPTRSGRAARAPGRHAGCPSWCRSATGGCWCRRSRSTGARR